MIAPPDPETGLVLAGLCAVGLGCGLVAIDAPLWVAIAAAVCVWAIAIGMVEEVEE